MGLGDSVQSKWRSGILAAIVVVLTWASGSVVKTAPAAGADPQVHPEFWSLLAAVPALNYRGAAAAELDGKLYVVGNDDSTVSRSYDPASNTWTVIASMHHRRQSASAVGVNGKLYAIGGQVIGQSDDPNCFAARIVEEYDPTTDMWTDKAVFPGCARDAGVAAVGTKIFQFGGRSNSGASSLVYEYDTVIDAWTALPDMTMPRTLIQAGAAVANNHIFLFGGVGDYRDPPSSNVWDYDLDQRTWTLRAWLPNHELPYAFALAVRDGLIYLIGGVDAYVGAFSTQVYIYDPALDRFSAGPSLVVPRFLPATATVGGRIYAVGGQGTGPGGEDAFITAEVLKQEVPPCLPGRYLAAPSDAGCSWAPAGSYVSDPGATSATLCAPGTYAGVGATSATLCGSINH